jgi:hypothetical protein
MTLIEKIVNCLGSKECFTSWTWTRIKIVVCILLYIVLIPLLVVALAFIGVHYEL